LLGLRSRQCPTGTASGIRGELRRLLQERGRGGEPAASAGPVGAAFELGGGVLVRAEHCPRAVPGALVRVGGRVGVGQRTVHAATVCLVGGLVDGGADQWVPESH
jgi:hypothetical protein